MFKRIFWGITFIIFAILLVLQAVGVTVNIFNVIPLWKLFLCVVVIYWIIEQLIKRNFSLVFFSIAIIAIVFEEELALLLKIEGGDIAPWWGFLLVAFLLSTGLSLLTKRTNIIKIGRGENNSTNGTFKSKNTITSSVVYIDCASENNQPLNEHIENDLGAFSVYFVNTEAYKGGGVLNVDNDLGSITIYIPKDWVVTNKIDNTLGHVEIPKPMTNEKQKNLLLTGDNDLGKITVQYIESEPEQTEEVKESEKEPKENQEPKESQQPK